MGNSAGRLAFDLQLLESSPDARAVIGVDEVGRGALAGPVMAAAFRIERTFLKALATQMSAQPANPWAWINDSKQLSAARRRDVAKALADIAGEGAGSITFAVGEASVTEIEQLNILGATRLAMSRAIDQLLTAQPNAHLEAIQAGDVHTLPLWNALAEPLASHDLLIIDGRPLKSFKWVHRGIVRGDAQSLAIAAASILAKVCRDARMEQLDQAQPAYGFKQNAGYGTAAHREAIIGHGPGPHHRSLFLRKLNV